MTPGNPAHSPSHGSPTPVPLVPSPKSKMPGWVIALLVVGAVVLLGIPCLIGAVAVMVPRMQEEQKRFACAENLSQLGQIFVWSRKEDAVPLSGPALFLEWRSTQSRIRAGQERVLTCPGDIAVAAPGGPGDWGAYDSVDLEHAPRALCSYAVRDFAKFPLVRDADTPLPIAACIHHRRGANVLFDDGATRFLELDELGLDGDDEVTVGPDSKSPVLRVVRYGDGSTR